MAYAENNLRSPSRPSRVEYIELAEICGSVPITSTQNNERRLSNRTKLTTVEVRRIIKRDFLRLWRQVKSIPCELHDISFTGIGIKSRDLIRIGDTITLSLRCPINGVEQEVPVRICNHYREQSGSYAYGGTLERRLDSDFRRLIVRQLTRLEDV